MVAGNGPFKKTFLELFWLFELFFFSNKIKSCPKSFPVNRLMKPLSNHLDKVRRIFVRNKKYIVYESDIYYNLLQFWAGAMVLWLWVTTHVERLWVRIPAPYTGWTFFTFAVIIVKTKINEKEAEDGPIFIKKNNWVHLSCLSTFYRLSLELFSRRWAVWLEKNCQMSIKVAQK